MQQKWVIIFVGVVVCLSGIGAGKPLEPDDLRHYHSALIYGVSKACPTVSKSYKNMLKMVDQSANAKLEVNPLAVADTDSTNDRKVHLLIRKIRKCYKNMKVVTSPSQEAVQAERYENSDDHKHRNTPAMRRIHAYLDEEGREMRRAAQLDIVPTSENLLKFEKLGIQLMANLCKMNGNSKNEHSRVGALLLSALNSNPEIPKATIHQKEMEELISETGECAKLYNGLD